MSENTLLPEEEPVLTGQPLAARMRPSSLDEIAGQQHLLGPGKVLRRLISSDSISSMIFRSNYFKSRTGVTKPDSALKTAGN